MGELGITKVLLEDVAEAGVGTLEEAMTPKEGAAAGGTGTWGGGNGVVECEAEAEGPPNSEDWPPPVGVDGWAMVVRSCRATDDGWLFGDGKSGVAAAVAIWASRCHGDTGGRQDRRRQDRSEGPVTRAR